MKKQLSFFKKQPSFYYLPSTEHYITYHVYKNNLYCISLYYISYTKLYITYNMCYYS
jgi:hypothetical protein